MEEKIVNPPLDLTQVSLRELFDTVRAHLLKQGEKAANLGESNMCFYRVFRRGKAPLKCAVGCLIPDSYYCEQMESNTVSDLVKKSWLKLTNEQVYLLRALQRLHDSFDVEEWPERLIRMQELIQNSKDVYDSLDQPLTS